MMKPVSQTRLNMSHKCLKSKGHYSINSFKSKLKEGKELCGNVVYEGQMDGSVMTLGNFIYHGYYSLHSTFHLHL